MKPLFMKPMTHAFPALLCAALFLALAVVANAQTTTDNTLPDNAAPQATTDEANANAENRPEIRDERRNALSELIQKRVINLAANISNRFDAAAARLTNISGRLDSRIEKLKSQGVNTEIAEAELAEAQTALSEVTNGMRAIDEIVYESVTSETPRQTWQEVRTLFGEAKTDLLAAKTSLRAAVAALKVAITEAETGQGVSDAVDSDNATSSSLEN